MGSRRCIFTVLCGVLLVSALVLAGCEEARDLEVTSALVWSSVGGPMAGAEIPLGENSVLCHTFAVAGVAQGELFVNGAFANRAANPNPAATKFNPELTFQADTPGAYELVCVVIDQDGLTASSEGVTVFVTGEVPTPTTAVEIPTATPTSTEVPPTEVPPAPTPPPPTGTAVPPTATSIPPTSTRIPPTSTPLPTATLPLVRIVSFEVSKSQIFQGECVRFDFRVEGATAIYFDGEGATSPDSRDRCPTATREFELRAEGYGGPVTARLTVVVIQPSPTPGDTTGPSIVWKNQITNGGATTPVWCGHYCSPPCGYIDINAIVTDPSGVSSVDLYCTYGEGREAWCAAFTKGQRDLWTARYTPNLGSGTYHYRIRAVDDSPNSNVSWWGSGQFDVSSCIG